jgi:hypothetical protein
MACETSQKKTSPVVRMECSAAKLEFESKQKYYEDLFQPVKNSRSKTSVTGLGQPAKKNSLGEPNRPKNSFGKRSKSIEHKRVQGSSVQARLRELQKQERI